MNYILKRMYQLCSFKDLCKHKLHVLSICCNMLSLLKKMNLFFLKKKIMFCAIMIAILQTTFTQTIFLSCSGMDPAMHTQKLKPRQHCSTCARFCATPAHLCNTCTLYIQNTPEGGKWCKWQASTSKVKLTDHSVLNCSCCAVCSDHFTILMLVNFLALSIKPFLKSFFKNMHDHNEGPEQQQLKLCHPITLHLYK